MHEQRKMEKLEGFLCSRGGSGHYGAPAQNLVGNQESSCRYPSVLLSENYTLLLQMIFEEFIAVGGGDGWGNFFVLG